MIELDTLRLERLAPSKSQQMTDQVGATLGGLQGIDQKRLELQADRAAAADEPEIADDHAQEIIEIVRHAAREAADRLHLLRLDEPLLEALLLGDIGDDDADA